jgi:hypothetical protein
MNSSQVVVILVAIGTALVVGGVLFFRFRDPHPRIRYCSYCGRELINVAFERPQYDRFSGGRVRDVIFTRCPEAGTSGYHDTYMGDLLGVPPTATIPRPE